MYLTHLPNPGDKDPSFDLFENRVVLATGSPTSAGCLPRRGKCAATRTDKRRSRDAIFWTATSRSLRGEVGVDEQIERDNLKIPERKARRTVKQNAR
jgi:hypothetical protein